MTDIAVRVQTFFHTILMYEIKQSKIAYICSIIIWFQKHLICRKLNFLTTKLIKVFLTFLSVIISYILSDCQYMKIVLDKWYAGVK